jgi:hypothetical protein
MMVSPAHMLVSNKRAADVTDKVLCDDDRMLSWWIWCIGENEAVWSHSQKQLFNKVIILAKQVMGSDSILLVKDLSGHLNFGETPVKLNSHVLWPNVAMAKCTSNGDADFLLGVIQVLVRRGTTPFLPIFGFLRRKTGCCCHTQW